MNKNIGVTERELFHTQHYLNLEKRQFGERLNIVFNINETDFKMPSLSLQPIVENAVKHGIMPRKEGGTVVICSEWMDNVYLITVLDDGVGFVNDGTIHSKKKNWQNDHSGIGITNVQSRIQILCKGNLTIESEPAKGTKVTITIPEK